MKRNLAIFFNDGESDCIWKIQDAEVNFKKGLGENFSLSFKNMLDEESKQRIKESKNVFAYVNPYFSDGARMAEKGISLKNVLYSLCALANEVPNTNIFILPYTRTTNEEYMFYTYIEWFYQNSKTPPKNLFVHKGDIVQFDYYNMERNGQNAKRISLDKEQFDVIYKDWFSKYKTTTTNQNIGDSEAEERTL